MSLTAKYAKYANAGPAGGASRGWRQCRFRVVRVVRGSPHFPREPAWYLNYRTNNTTLQTFKVDGLNQLTNAIAVAYKYDANGNLTNAAGTSITYTYDDENRLSVIEQTYAFRSVFTYDGLGRLRQRDEYAWAGAPYYQYFIVNGASARYVYDGWRVIQERNDSNVPTVSYTRGTDLSGSLEGAGGIGGLLSRSHGYSSGTGNWSTHNHYHADGNGNITYLVNSSQGLAASYRYDPFGNTISSSGGLASANVYRFSSKEIIPTWNLYYYGHRFYAPNLQRWINRDPKREEGFQELRKAVLRGGTTTIDRSQRTGSKQNFEHAHLFALNNPIRRIDPKGLDAPGCDVLPDSWDNACRLECCARHDRCYDDPTHTCSAWSWLWTLVCPTEPCAACNWEAIDCFSQCSDGYGDNPDRHNYYCCQCHEYFNLEDPGSINDPQLNPHFGHRCP
jgi:RHS repeat-associated protein